MIKYGLQLVEEDEEPLRKSEYWKNPIDDLVRSDEFYEPHTIELFDSLEAAKRKLSEMPAPEATIRPHPVFPSMDYVRLKFYQVGSYEYDDFEKKWTWTGEVWCTSEKPDEWWGLDWRKDDDSEDDE